ncbi:MAG: hypothetical protein ACI9FJ_001959, partial [Alteromonadaceae bacterium]
YCFYWGGGKYGTDKKCCCKLTFSQFYAIAEAILN